MEWIFSWWQGWHGIRGRQSTHRYSTLSANSSSKLYVGLHPFFFCAVAFILLTCLYDFKDLISVSSFLKLFLSSSYTTPLFGHLLQADYNVSHSRRYRPELHRARRCNTEGIDSSKGSERKYRDPSCSSGKLDSVENSETDKSHPAGDSATLSFIERGNARLDYGRAERSPLNTSWDAPYSAGKRDNVEINLEPEKLHPANSSVKWSFLDATINRLRALRSPNNKSVDLPEESKVSKPNVII